MGLFRPSVEKMKKKKDLEGLKKAYQDHLDGAGEALLHVASEKGDVETLIQFLRGEYNSYKCKAAIELGRLKDPRAVKPLVDVLYSSPSDELGIQAAAALKAIHDPRTAELISEVIWGSGEDTWRIIGLLKDLKDKKGIPKLIHIMRCDQGPHNREYAARAIEEIGGEECVEALIETRDRDSESSVRYAAERALVKIRDSSSKD